MMASGGRVQGRGVLVLSCVGLSVWLAAADNSFAGDDDGSIAALAQQMAVQDEAAGGSLFVLAAHEEPAGEASQPEAMAEAVAQPSSTVMKAGPVDVAGGFEVAGNFDAEAPAADPTPVEPVAAEAPMQEVDLRATGNAERFVDAVRADEIPAAEPSRVVMPEDIAVEAAAPAAPQHVQLAQADVAVDADALDPATTDAPAGVAPGRPRLAENPTVPSTFEKLGAKDGIMRVLAGKSLVIDLHRTAKRVSVANPEVAEVLVISPRQVMINGLANGETSIIIWDTDGNYTMNTLVVGDQLQDQVMLEVTVAEINRTAAERHGVDVRALGGQFGTVTQFGNAAPTSGTFPAREGEPLFPFGLDGGISWAVIDFKNDIAAFFEQIQKEDLGRILAEPKLLARSGKEANFLSGGEIPIVITQNDDTTIEFKEFGTRINFVPEVREDGTIDLKVKSEVSEPDFSNGVDLFGFRVPAFVTRRVDTDVTLRSAQSLVIAGLIKETKQELESKLPFAGDIPILGYFFRSTEFEKNLLELIIVVKPKIVAPIAEGERVPLPTDRGPLTRGEVRTKAEPEKVSRPRPY